MLVVRTLDEMHAHCPMWALDVLNGVTVEVVSALNDPWMRNAWPEGNGQPHKAFSPDL